MGKGGVGVAWFQTSTSAIIHLVRQSQTDSAIPLLVRTQRCCWYLMLLNFSYMLSP